MLYVSQASQNHANACEEAMLTLTQLVTVNTSLLVSKMPPVRCIHFLILS